MMFLRLDRAAVASRRLEKGFTLVEMLVTVSIIVIIAGITIPLFVTSRARTRRTEATNAIQSVLAAAREAAIERRTIVAVEFVSDPTSTNRGDFIQIVDKTSVRSEPKYANPALRRIGEPTRLPDFIKLDSNRLLASGAFYTSPEWTVLNGWKEDSLDRYDIFSLSPSAPGPYPDIAFLPDGTLADPEGTTNIAIIDTAETARNVLRALTSGLVIRARHLQDPSLPYNAVTNPETDGRGDNWL